MTHVPVIWRFMAMLIPLLAIYWTWVMCPLQRENTPVYKALVTPDIISLVIFALGIAWCRALQTSKLDAVYDGLVLVLICFWIVVYSRQCTGPHTEHSMKLSLCILILSLLLVLVVIVTSRDLIHRMCLVPLAIWLILLVLYQTQRKAVSSAHGALVTGDTIE